MIRTVYLSGPISLNGRSSTDEVLAFTEVFNTHALRLRESGYTVLNPTDLPEGLTWEIYMRHAMHAVADADVVAQLPRWAESRGATLEAFVATQLGIPLVPVEDVT